MDVVPRPRSIQAREGSFTLDANVELVASAAAFDEARKFQRRLFQSLGLNLRLSETAPTERSQILFSLKESSQLDEEGYILDVSSTMVSVEATKPAGLYYGSITFLQLLPSIVFSNTTEKVSILSAPCYHIEDSPRFSWRGMHLDVARHFMPIAFVKKFIDVLSLHKMNRFHWHLTDDQGWRIQIKKYPKLTEIGAWRKETRIGHEKNGQGFDEVRHGGFYTQDEVKEIIEYASERHIIVVPEIEMPGHVTAAIASYPELGNGAEGVEVWPCFGVNSHVLNVEDSTIVFFQNILDEICILFPGPYVHVGGDECPKEEWRASEVAQARIKALSLRNEHELQSWFISQMDAFCIRKEKS